MPSIKIISAFDWGVDRIVVTEGDGTGVGPAVNSAVATSRNTITVTFSREMSFHLTDSRVLEPGSYFIEDPIFNRRLYVLRVLKISDQEVQLITQDMEPIDYDLTVSYAQDKFGIVVDPANNTATFTGIDPKTEFPVANSVMSYWGLYGGLQTSEETSIVPDVLAPYLDNLDPDDTDIEVPKDKILYLEIKDDDLGVELSLVKIFIDGVIAYNGNLDTFVAPFNGVSSNVVKTSAPNLYKFYIQKTSDWDSYADVEVHVFAGDKTPIPNYLDQIYTFRVEDYIVPILINEAPTGVDVPKASNISFTLSDVDGSGVDGATIQVTVNGVPAMVDGAFQLGWGGPGSQVVANAPQNGYDVTIDPTEDFDTYESVTVNALFKDNEGKQGSFNWTFRVEDYLGPLVTPVTPLDGEEGVSLSKSIQVQITDEQDIQGGTTLVEIDVGGGGYEVAYEDGGSPEFKPGWDGPASAVVAGPGIKDITIDPVATFPFATVVSVRVTSLDVEGNPERLS